MNRFYPRFLLTAALAGLIGSHASAQYCTPLYVQGCSFGSGIETFILNGESSTSINDATTGCSPIPTAYRDSHTTMSVTLNAGGTYTVQASKTTAPVPLPGTTNNFQVWIDLDNNGTFSSTESVGGGGTMATTLTSYTINIPSTATAGARRMRAVISGDLSYPSLTACPSGATWGEVHDYTVNIVTAAACPPVTGLTVSAITSGGATASWTAATGATGYEWAITTSATPPASGTATTLTTATSTTLSPSTVYYAHVRSVCGSAFSSWVTSTSFTTLATSTSCPAVTGITMSGVTSSAATLGWSAVTGAIGYEWAVTASATPPASGTATTLLTATAGSLTAGTAYYAHVRAKCSATLFSAWTTQTFTTTAASTCPAITGLSASAITTTGATVSWTAVASGSLGYQYVIDNVVTDPTGSGTNTTATSTSPATLTPGTTYYAHVRDSCGVGNFSAWSTIPFTTLATAGGCNAVTGLTVTGITSTGATLNWTMASGAVGAKWVVNTVATAPTVFGTLSTTSTAAVTSLTASTTYYAHVRDTCGPGSVSAWVTVPFTTAGTVGIAEVGTGALPFSVAAFPNPAHDAFTVQVSGAIGAHAQLTLTDVTGKTVRQMSIDNYTTQVDVNNLPAGVYILRYTDNGMMQTLRVSKQ